MKPLIAHFISLLACSVTCLVIGFLICRYNSAWHYKELMDGGLSQAQVQETAAAMPALLRNLESGNDEAAVKLALIYKLLLLGKEAGAKAELQMMLHEYEKKARADSDPTEHRKSTLKIIDVVKRLAQETKQP